MSSATIGTGARLMIAVALTTIVGAAPVTEHQGSGTSGSATVPPGARLAAGGGLTRVAPGIVEVPASTESVPSSELPDVVLNAVARPTVGANRYRGLGQAMTRTDLARAMASSESSSQCLLPDEGTLDAILPVATDHGSRASGVVFATNRVLTAAHAVMGGSRFYVRVGKDYRTADLMLIDHDQDLAVLAVDTGGIQPLPVQPTEPSNAQPVWAVGFPRAEEMHASYGVFQRNRAGALHTSASIDSGQSGGGLLACRNGSWHLLGMLRGYGAFLSGDQYVKLQNHSVSVAATTIHHFLSVPRARTAGLQSVSLRR